MVLINLADKNVTSCLKTQTNNVGWKTNLKYVKIVRLLESGQLNKSRIQFSSCLQAYLKTNSFLYHCMLVFLPERTFEKFRHFCSDILILF